jgi:Secretion system C-terminal sorting domain
MKKTFTLFAAALFVFGTATAQSPSVPSAEVAPSTGNNNPPPTVQAPWQVLFSHDITAGGAGTGNAGVVPVGLNFWVSRWGTDTFFVVTATGSVTSSFTVPGVTGVRSLTTDGSFVYAGANTANIYKINTTTQTLAATISVPSVPNVRYCTYDPTANSNAGGFWVGTWATDFTLVDMSGNVLNSILAGTHGQTATYGLAFDGASPGGPYLWGFHQTGTTSNADLVQISISTGAPTSVIHDVTADMGTAGDLAGGVYVNANPLVLFGVLQGTANLLFSYDIAGVNGVNEVAQTDFVAVYPNPAAQSVNIRVNRTNNDPMQIQIINALGQVVSASQNVGINNIYNIENLAAGVYSVQVINNGVVYTTKLVKE